jgi:ABC-type lipoprotein release transport system permease subunit
VSGRKKRGEETVPVRDPPKEEELRLKAYGYILANARANPLRVGATITAVAVAVAFIIIVGSLSVGLEGAEQRELLDYTLGTPELPISNFIQTEEGEFVGLFATTLFDPDEVVDIGFAAQQYVGSLEGATAYPYTERVLERTPFTGLTYHVSRVLAVDPDQGVTTPYTKYHTHLQLAIGEHLDDLGANDVVLGNQLWQDRFPGVLPGAIIDLVPDGETWFGAPVEHLRSSDPVTLTRLPFLDGLRLRGVLDKDLSTDRNAYVPLGYFANLTGADHTVDGPRSEAISVEVNEENVDMQDLTERLLGETDRVSSLFITSVTSSAENQLAEDLTSAIYSWLVLAVVVILVGMVLGIANTSFLTVTQRVREIGTLRALGLSRTQVRNLVQWDTLFIGMMGWVIGFFSGLIVSSSILNVVYEVEDLGIILAPGRTVPFVVIGTVLAVILAAIVGAEIPARKASQMSPLEALSAPL